VKEIVIGAYIVTVHSLDILTVEYSFIVIRTVSIGLVKELMIGRRLGTN